MSRLTGELVLYLRRRHREGFGYDLFLALGLIGVTDGLLWRFLYPDRPEWQSAVGFGMIFAISGAGFLLAQKRLGPGRIHHCQRWMGICNRALELMKQRANEREIKPGEVLADTQIVRQWMAECTTEYMAARGLILQAAWTIEQRGFAEARDMVSMIKFHAANVTQKVLDTAIQLHGGLGMTDDTPIAYWWRHERAARIFDGPDEVHKLSLGKRLLRQ